MRTSFLSLLLVVLAVAAAATHVVQATCFTASERAVQMALIEADLAAAGFGVVEGDFRFFNVSTCQNSNCFFQNPTSPYGFIRLPNNPRQGPLLYQLPAIGVNVSWRLEPSETVLLFGCMPPTSRYVGFTPYVTWHYRPNFPGTELQKWVNVFGSMSDTLNQATLQTFPDGPFGANVVVVITASSSAYSQLAPIIANRLNISTSAVNLLPLPALGLNLQMGLTQHADLFSFLFRQAIPTDQAAYDAWEASNPFSVARVYYATPPNNTNTLYGAPTLRPRNISSTGEVPLQSSLNNLVNQTILNLAGRYNIDVVNWVPNLLGYQLADWGGVCYLAGLQCSGDNRDATYLVSNLTVLFPQPTDQYLVLGANHHHNGLAVYSNLVLYNYVGALGVVDVNDDQYINSANQPVPDYTDHLPVVTNPLNSNNYDSTNDDDFSVLDNVQYYYNDGDGSASSKKKRDGSDDQWWGNNWGSGWNHPRTTPTPTATPVNQAFFRWRFARSCAPLDQYCSPVPATGFPSIPPNSVGLISTRAYEVSNTFAGPTPAVLIKPVMLHLVDRCAPQACDATASCGTLPNYALYDIAFASQTVAQSSTFKSFAATYAVDGNADYFAPSATTNFEFQPYWQIDLTFQRNVKSIQLKGFWGNTYVLLSNTPFTSAHFETAKAQATVGVFRIPGGFSLGDITEAFFDWDDSPLSNLNLSFQYMRIQETFFGSLVLSDVQVLAYCQTPAV